MTEPPPAPAAGPQQPGNGIPPPSPGPPAEGAPASQVPGEAQPGTPDQPHTYAVGSGPAASDATSRSGQGSTRHQFLREADRLLVEGDVVARGVKNVINLPGARRRRPREISPDDLELLRNAYVCPPGFASIQSSYSRARQTVILRGPEGCGKLATAVRLLLDEGAGHIFRLDDSIRMSEVPTAIETDLKGRERIEENAGFILNQPADFANLRSSLLQQLEEPLRAAGARLIITVAATALGSDNDLLDYAVDQSSRPDPQDIVARHLRHFLGASRTESELARPEIGKLIAGILTPDSSGKDAADLADAIVDELYQAPDTQNIDTGRIRSRLSRRSSEGFEIWFATLGDTWSTTFAIALAVLNGLPYEVVVRGAKALYGAYDAEPGVMMAAAGDALPETRRPFRTSRRALLYRLHAQITRVESAGPYGLSVADTVEYQDPRYPLSVMRHAWSNYQIQDALLQWLAELADDGMELVRVFAGRALGVLAALSFDYLTSRVLVPWAASDQPGRGAAVAYALRFVAADHRLRQAVRRLVSGWYADRDHPALQATAARAYGLALGAYDPIAAVEALDRLSVVDDIRVAVSIGDAVVDLLAETSDDLTAPEADNLAVFALRKLREALGHPDRTAMAQLVFLILADGLYTRVRKDARSPFVAWPYLLRLGQRLPSARTALVELWRYVLNDARFPGESQQVLAWWAGAAENDSEMREALLRLVRALVRGHERTRVIVSRYTTGWASPENLSPIPVVGQALLTVLEAEREPL